MNLTNYVPVLLFIFAATGLGLLVVGIGFLFGPRKPDPAKLSPYECGFEVFEDARMRFDVRYYLITILFILFDLETAFLVPWAVSLKDLSTPEAPLYGLMVMLVFLAELVLGYIYIWKKGALEWE
ncbi:MAG: NADH-quinone oxidoreductase subunit A [Burkholderiales bacterium]|jgi:NADH-quinone oxidoreductase subunit A|nr:NADH-quinone oxidoreductase subunit A [Burkholderiales bacterium]MCE1176217.1 NADH-quinone oxidoreductase subunit A [Burkholderiales bacterium]